MKVIAGKLKGKNISFVNDKYNNANVTPQKVKEALFSILGNDLAGKSFLDLYACSGQVGIEAFSRGAEFVAFNEIDQRRFKFLGSQIEKLNISNNTLLLKYHSFRCLRYLSKKEYLFDFIFLDPPYRKKKSENKDYYDILNEIDKNPVLKDSGIIIIQHYSKNDLTKEVGNFQLIETKKYANNSLSFYRIKQS